MGLPEQEQPSEAGSTVRRIAINTVSNWIAMGVQLGSSFFLLAYVLRRFDDPRFGAYGLALSIGQPISFLSFGMAATVLRMASRRVASEDWDSLSGMLSMARTLLWGAGVVAVVLVLVVSFGCLSFLNVPEEIRGEVSMLFVLTGVGAALHLVRIVYRGMVLAKQRYDLANAVMASESIVRTVFAIVCFQYGWLRLEVLGLGQALTALAGLIVLVLIAPPAAARGADVVPAFLPRHRARSAGGDGMDGRGDGRRISLEEGIFWLVSAVERLGLLAVGYLTLPARMSQYLIRVVTGLTMSLWPVAATYAVRGQRESLVRLYQFGTRFTVVVLVAAIAPLVTHGHLLLRCLRPEFEQTYPLMLLYVGLFAARSLAVPAEHIILGAGRVRPVGISQLLGAVLGFAMAAYVAFGTDWGLHAFVAALFVPASLRGLVYLPLRMREEVGAGYWDTVWRCVVPGTLGGIVPLAVGYGLRVAWPSANLLVVVVQMAAASLAYVAVVWFVVLQAGERESFIGLLRRGRSKPPDVPNGPADGEAA